MPLNARKRWTVLIYMVADDPQGGELLDQEAVREMDQITKATLSVPKPEHLYVALQVDFRTLPGVWRRVIGQSTFVRPESNAADPATLYGFFDWAVTECPAEHYLLIFWGHSRGQFGLFGDPNPFEYTAQTLTLDELYEALSAAKRSLGKAVDIIAFKDCFMATLETAYQLSGLADYLLASPGLVPVLGWPYDAMFGALAAGDQAALGKATLLLKALGEHYKKEENKHPFEEVPYSLLSTRGASVAVEKLANLIGKDRRVGARTNDEPLRRGLDKAKKVSDPALVDLGTLALGAEEYGEETVAPQGGRAAPKRQREPATKHFDEFVRALGNASTAPDKTHVQVNKLNAAAPEGLVIEHTGQEVGGVSVFVYPSSPKSQRESLLTRLADEKVYRGLAISTDTNWADIALQSMPIQQARPRQDVSAAVGLLEQLQRLGVGMAYGAAASNNAYLESLIQRSRNGALTEADMAQATQYAAIAQIAARLVAFAAGKGTDGFGGKGTDGFGGKGTDGFGGKGTDGFGGKGTDGFVGKGTDGFIG